LPPDALAGQSAIRQAQAHSDWRDAELIGSLCDADPRVGHGQNLIASKKVLSSQIRCVIELILSGAALPYRGRNGLDVERNDYGCRHEGWSGLDLSRLMPDLALRDKRKVAGPAYAHCACLNAVASETLDGRFVRGSGTLGGCPLRCCPSGAPPAQAAETVG
jgi:hypothetical protein